MIAKARAQAPEQIASDTVSVLDRPLALHDVEIRQPGHRAPSGWPEHVQPWPIIPCSREPLISTSQKPSLTATADSGA
ncbi:hypothetical protein QF000_000107 [Paraburkholderia atlantica]|nr:hypothetical protein [Paraburkholderia atlantica]